MTGPTELTGRLFRAVVAPGSKSERESLVLEADDGRVLPVRRRGGPSFGVDRSRAGADLEALADGAGTRVVLSGTMVAGTLIADSWQPVEPGG